MKFATACAATMLGSVLGACTPIGETRVAGWPEMQVVEHHVSHREMRDRCMQYVGFGTSPEACAEFDFSALRCDIWLSADFPPPAFIVEHERQHCLGYEHVGEDGLSVAWNQYLEAKKAVAAASLSASQGASLPPAKQR
jgi:hypothetical protein